MTHVIISGLIDTGKLTAAILTVFGLLMAHRGTRYVTLAIRVFALRHAPKWLAPMLMLGQFIVGPFDEVIVISIALLVIFRKSSNRALFRRYVSYAWRASREN